MHVEILVHEFGMKKGALETNSRHGGIGYPRLAAVDDEPAVDFLRHGFHTGWVRAVVGLGQTLK